MKSVLHVMNSLERSGVEMMLLNSCAEWQSSGYRGDIVATADSEGPVAEQFRECGYGVFHIPFRSKCRYLPRAEFLREFFRVCSKGYDVVHIHTETAPPIFAILAKMAGVPRIVVTPHNTFKYQGALRLRKRGERQVVRLLGGRFGMVSDGVKQWEWERFHNSGKRISYWIDTAHFRIPTEAERSLARRELSIADDCFVTVSVANCNRVKNHVAILRAIALMRSDMRPLHLHIGREEGGFPERELAAELDIGHCLRFLGSLPDPLPFFWAADAFLMPSLHEGLGLAAVEAVASGLPLVCSKVEGLTDIAALTRFTVLTDTTPESLAAALGKVRQMQPEERRLRAVSDSQRLRRVFSARDGVRSFINLYEDEVAA